MSNDKLVKDREKLCLLVSYVPLLTPKGSLKHILETVSDQTYKDFENSMDDIPGVEGCLWTLDDEYELATPVFIMKNAHAIAEHLEEWAENAVDKWFKLVFTENDEKYSVTLWPNLEESVARFKLRYLMEKEEFVEDFKFQIFFHPLNFVSGMKNNMFTNIKPKIGPKTSVGFLDIGDFDPADPGSIDSDDIKKVGPFSTNFDGHPFGSDMSSYVNHQIEDATPLDAGSPINGLGQWRNPNINLENLK